MYMYIFLIIIAFTALVNIYYLISLKGDLNKRIRILDIKINGIAAMSGLIVEKYYPEKDVTLTGKSDFYAHCNPFISMGEIDELSSFAKDEGLVFFIENSEEMMKTTDNA